MPVSLFTCITETRRVSPLTSESTSLGSTAPERAARNKIELESMRVNKVLERFEHRFVLY